MRNRCARTLSLLNFHQAVIFDGSRDSSGARPTAPDDAQDEISLSS